jgi:hypothetical protein
MGEAAPTEPGNARRGRKTPKSNYPEIRKERYARRSAVDTLLANVEAIALSLHRARV